ncbi:efflux transporter outer membrane subunit [Paraburkholderia hospita]|jgi:NodT family efflux transporter outer membrane factor (OMF) lipoprotein|uniref:efflux transporter outer membrane subunit n=1 Tax=Paraburkholderia hospita TaxID=169430 RepID=UPI000B34A0B9|nr:efflux transporter outer membrane subunit [Paraburkholderia hospita]OUL70545.1 RND transporter [Paraburkholderia hospita]
MVKTAIHKRARSLPWALPTLLAGTTLVAGCSLAPDYKVPPSPVAGQYRTMGPWVDAKPSDQLNRDGWWKMYGDTQLDDLEERLIANNTDLRAAFAHYQQAQAFVEQVSAGLFPSVAAVAVPQRNRQSATRPLRAGGPDYYNSVTLGGEINYDLDLWGRVRDSVKAGKDEAQASKADLASVQLSLQVELADSYVRLRGLDQQTQLLRESVVEFAKALQLTQTLHSGGIVAGLDVSRAQTQLSSAQSMLSQNLAQRALLEHAIAVLVGASASEFTLPEETASIPLPVIPVGVPSALLQRRPDIAAAERRVAEANEKIGVARAAYFPSITLSAQGGLQSAAYAGLFSAPNLFWTVGPQLVQYVFDGGLRRGQLDAAKASMDEAGALYRGIVLSAFQQVEDNLTLLSDLGTALGQQRDAAQAAQHSVDLALTQYRQGAIGYLDVVTAQTAALDAQRALIDIQTRQLSANVQLIHAVGGGWSDDALAQTDAAPALAAAPSPGR